MKRDDHLTASGLAVTIVFGTAIIGFTIALIIMKVKERQTSRRAEAERAALLGGGFVGKPRSSRNDVETADAYPQVRRNARNPLSPLREAAGSEANLPLIAPGGPRSDQPQYDDFGQDETVGEQGRAGPPNVPPKLHQGLGALAQDGVRRTSR